MTKTLEDVDKLELLAASYACDYRDSGKSNVPPDSHLVYSVAYDAFLTGYKAAQDQVADVSKVMLQWISVSDRLPPDTTKDWFVVLLDNMGCLKTIGSSQYIYGDWLQIREGLVQVTHWAEMPEELP